MKYQIYIYVKTKYGKFCRMFYTIDNEGFEKFHKAIIKENILSKQEEASYIRATKFVNDNKLKLIDEFQIEL